MFKIGIVVFREFLEIALLLGVILAATKPITNSRVYILFGTLTGIVLAAVFALFTRSITRIFGEIGDELFDSIVILITALIISWTVVWMQGYTGKIKRDLGQLSENIKAGLSSQITLALVVSTVILREGAEIILFVYSLSSVGQIAGSEYLIGIGIGATVGLTVGTVIYLGLIKFAGKYIFKISTILLTLIAAGLASEAAGIVTSTGIIESFSDQLWDTSRFIDNTSIFGKLLKITIGYDSKPNTLQIIFYLGSILLTSAMIKLRSLTSNRHNKQQIS